MSLDRLKKIFESLDGYEVGNEYSAIFPFMENSYNMVRKIIKEYEHDIPELRNENSVIPKGTKLTYEFRKKDCFIFKVKEVPLNEESNVVSVGDYLLVDFNLKYIE